MNQVTGYGWRFMFTLLMAGWQREHPTRKTPSNIQLIPRGSSQEQAKEEDLKAVRGNQKKTTQVHLGNSH